MVLNVFLLILGIALLVKGADWFVSGSSHIAKALKIPPLVIGLTLVSMGTSAPEASVSINSAIQGMSDMSLGNVVGSNIFNTLFILGVSTLILPMAIRKEIKRYDIPIMLASYVILIIFSFAISPLKLSTAESILLLLAFVIYTVFLILRAIRSKRLNPLNERLMNDAVLTTPLNDCTNTAQNQQDIQIRQTPQNDNEKPVKQKRKKPLILSIFMAAIGLAGVIFGGDLVVDKASEIAKALGMSEILVGLTIVAVGTSLPELVTSVVASIKKENDIAIGNVVGSNIFNIVFILGLSSSINNIVLSADALVDALVMLGSGILVMLLCFLRPKRWQGVLMIALYVGYLAYIILRN